MALTLYFSNKQDKTCWPVRNVNGQPVEFAVTKKSGPYRNQFQTSATVVPGQFGSSGQIVVPGVASLVALYDATGPVRNELVPTIVTPSDEVAGEPLRQDALEYTHWKVPTTTEDGVSFQLISMDEYPDGYSNRPPSWWEDPLAV